MLQVGRGQIALPDASERGLGLAGPPFGDIAAGLPDARLGHRLRQPCEMVGHVHECGGRGQELAVHVARACQQHPGIVEIWIVFFALHPPAVFGIGASACLTARLLLYRAQAYGFLGFLYRAAEVALRLRGFRVVARLGGMHGKHAGEVVVVGPLHVAERLTVVLLAVEHYVVARYEGLILTVGGAVLAGRASGRRQHRRDGRDP